MISKRFTPIYISEKMHSITYIGMISAAADIVDFNEYTYDPDLINDFGVDFFCTLILISSFQFAFVLTAKKKINNAGELKIFKSLIDLFLGSIYILIQNYIKFIYIIYINL